jgi:peptidoglycan/LPS O-acetylase OafA/YrhL
MNDERISILDGWRALSILAVLAGHLLPLGPGRWGLNGAVAASGMAIFFTLSGFLITRVLIADPRVPQFLIRRLFRIVPLAWAAMIVLAASTGANPFTLFANLAFFSNLPPAHLMHGGEHLWSLCVEVQFYLFAALIVLCAGRRSLYLLPILMVAVTALRIVDDAPISIITWERVDEILAGATVALLYHHGLLQRWAARLPRFTMVLLLPLIVLSGHPSSGDFMYFRPYVTAATVAISMITAPGFVRAIFVSRPAVYIATISYALYVFHGMLGATWLGSGDTITKYAKRPLLFAVTWGLSHFSTFYFEARMIALGKKLARGVGARAQPSA